MVTVYKNLLTADAVRELVDYLDCEDSRSDVRSGISSKHPRWDIDDWPQNIVSECLNTLIDYQWAVDELVMFSTYNYTQSPHVDSHREWPVSMLGPAFLFPLEFSPRASTVFFDNYWTGTTGKFSKQAAKKSINANPAALGQGQNLISDYTNIVNINDQPFDETMYYQYLDYLPIEDLHGLTVDTVVDWHVGDVISWDRTQLHCSSNQHHYKKYLTVFTYKLDKVAAKHI
jgi:hypothetical protein